MSAPFFGARYPGPPVPHVAISREERDLAHAGYELHYSNRAPKFCNDLVAISAPREQPCAAPMAHRGGLADSLAYGFQSVLAWVLVEAELLDRMMEFVILR